MILKQEDLHTEFKSSFSDKVIVGLVAFANAKGGTVYIGVDDDGTVVGVRLGKETVAQWINEVKSKTEPSIIPDVEIQKEDEKTIVLFCVQEYPVKPVSVKGKYYCRRQNSNHLLSAGEIADMSLQTRNSSWDYYTDPLHTIDDLNLGLVRKSIAQMNRRGMNITESPEEYIRKKGLCNATGQLTFGGYLLFKQEEDLLTTIELGHFQDKNGIFIKDSARSKASLIEQVEDVMQFVKKHINTQSTVGGKSATADFVTCEINKPAGFNNDFTTLKVSIKVLNTDKTYTYPNTNTYPNAIMIPGKWKWPKEKVNITNAYSMGYETAADHSFGTWASEYPHVNALDWYDYPVTNQVVNMDK